MSKRRRVTLRTLRLLCTCMLTSQGFLAGSVALAQPDASADDALTLAAGAVVVHQPQTVNIVPAKDASGGPSWFPVLLPVVGTLVAAGLAFHAQRLVSATQASSAIALAQAERINSESLEAIRQSNASSLESIRHQLELRLESDRLLQEKRILHYERALLLMQNLPKYPAPRTLSGADLRALADALQVWYFGGAGLYMNTEVRNAYFDLQDGLRVVLARCGLLIPPPGEISPEM